MRRLSICLLFALAIFSLKSQTLSPAASISLITAAPGAELYSAFGHSAIRVKDPVNRIDSVWNYGTFDFNTPGFYLKFMQGKLNYMIDKDPWRNFEYVYHYLERSYEEQVLDLSQDQKQRVYDFLRDNYRPENRYYLYDFFFDNCATRLRDVVEQELGDSLRWGPPTKTGASFRDYLHEYLTEKAWISFGIDLALGAVVDREADVREQMFLPDYLASAFGGAEVLTQAGWQPLVTNDQQLYEGPDLVEPTPWFVHPLTIGLLILLAMGWFTWKRWKGSRLVWPDVLFWSVLGLTGIVGALLWFATDHTAPAQNWNLLWIQPLHLVAAVGLLRKQRPGWLRWYLLIAGGLGLVLLLAGPLLPQAFPLSFYPWFAMVALRGLAGYKGW